jgi:hypothetical protein
MRNLNLVRTLVRYQIAMMTFREQLELVIARTGVRRYKYLCLEHPDRRVRKEYMKWVSEEAGKIERGEGQYDPSQPVVTFDWTNADSNDCDPCDKEIKPQRVRRDKP